MNIREKLARTGNYGGSRSADQIKYLVVHYTGNSGDTAKNNAAYFASRRVGASAHYFVDDTEVWRSVKDLHTAWAVGGRKYPSCAQTGGGTMYGLVTNRNSLSVELCGTGEGSAASEKTLERAAELCRSLMDQYNIPLENVYRHFDVTGKLCPAYMVERKAWSAFKSRLEDTMTQEQFDKMMDDYLARKAKESPSISSAEARAWAEANGIIGGFQDGTKQYKSPCTREQVAIMLHRMWTKLHG